MNQSYPYAQENLGKGMGQVEVQLRSFARNGKRYTVTRRVGEAPMARDADGQVSTLAPRDLLPGLDIYGQNEIYELARDEGSGVRLLQRFLPQDQDGRARLGQRDRRPTGRAVDRRARSASRRPRADRTPDRAHETVHRGAIRCAA